MKINQYSYKPNYVIRGNNQQNIYGLEIETEFLDDNKNEYFDSYDLHEYRQQIYLKEDGSLNNGVEIITQPASFEFINSTKFKLFDFISKIQSCCNSYNNSTCGMHIHINKKSFYNKIHLLKFVSFFQANYNKILKHISERSNISQVRHYCNNIQKRNIIQSLNGNYRTRFIACNVTDYTVEIRIFQGNLKRDRILKNIEFVDCLINYTSKQPTLKLSKSFAKFKKYLVLNKSIYPNFYKFLILNNKTI